MCHNSIKPWLRWPVSVAIVIAAQLPFAPFTFTSQSIKIYSRRVYGMVLVLLRFSLRWFVTMTEDFAST